MSSPALPTPPTPAPPSAAPPAVAKLRSLVLAGIATALAVILLLGARQGIWVQTVAIAFAQVACIVSWIVATKPQNQYLYGGGALAVATLADIGAVTTNNPTLADIGAVTTDNPTLAPIGYALAVGLFIAVLGQLARRDGRAGLTDALAGAVALNVIVAGYAVALVGAREHYRVLALGLLAAGVAVATARIVDIVPAGPRLDPHVPRSLLGLVVGMAAGVGVAMLAGTARTDLPLGLCALVGVLGAGGAIVADLGVSVAERGDSQSAPRHAPASPVEYWLAAARGPLTAFAGALPAVYVAVVLTQGV